MSDESIQTAAEVLTNLGQPLGSTGFREQARTSLAKRPAKQVQQRRPVRTKAAWANYVYEQNVGFERPEMMSASSWRAMSLGDRRSWAGAARFSNMRLGPYDLPSAAKVGEDLTRLVGQNLYVPDWRNRTMAAIDAPALAGKSTLAMEVLRAYENARRLVYGPMTSEGHEYWPVVFLSLPASCTIKDFNRLVGRWLGVELPRTESEGVLTVEALRWLALCGVEVLFIDDVHRMRVRSEKGGTLSDHIRHIQELTGLTILFAGVDLKRKLWFFDGDGLPKSRRKDPEKERLAEAEEISFQTAERCKRHGLEAIDWRKADDRDAWTSLCGLIDDDVRVPGGARLSEGTTPSWLARELRGKVGRLMELVMRASHASLDRALADPDGERLGLSVDDLLKTEITYAAELDRMEGAR